MLKKSNLYRSLAKVEWSTIAYLICVLFVLLRQIDASATLLTTIRIEVSQFANFIARPFCFIYEYAEDFGSVRQIKREKQHLAHRVAVLKKEVAQRDIAISKIKAMQKVKDFIQSQPTLQTYMVAEFLFRIRDSGALVLARCANLDRDLRRVDIVNNMLVTDSSGVIGKIIEADNSANKNGLDSTVCIALISDLRFRIAATTATSNEIGILAGIGKNSMMEFKYFNSPHKIKLGELVVTMGDRSTTPKDVLIGHVAMITENKIFVAPLADVHRLGYMAIIATPKI